MLNFSALILTLGDVINLGSDFDLYRDQIDIYSTFFIQI